MFHATEMTRTSARPFLHIALGIAVALAGGLAAHPADASPAISRPGVPGGADGCAAAIQRDLGADAVVVEGLCLEGYALVDMCAGCLGDTWAIAQFDRDRWETIISFPTATCRQEALDRGIPSAIVDRVVWPCDGAATPGTPPPAVENFPLTEGISGAIVETAQRNLVALGFGVGESGVDGHFGPDTAGAVAAWQTVAGYAPDGSLPQDQFDRLAAMAGIAATVPADYPVGAFLTAPVPGLCGHPEGALVSGALPGIPENMGMVTLSGYYERIAFGDLDGDGIPEAAVTFACNQGGVAWPEWIVIYKPGPIVAGAVDLGTLTSAAQRANVTALTYGNSVFDVSWTTTREDDAACCGTLDVTARIAIEGGQVAATGVTEIGESALLDALVGAGQTDDVTAVQALFASPDAINASLAGFPPVAIDVLAASLPEAADAFTCVGELNELAVSPAVRQCRFESASGTIVLDLTRVGPGQWLIGATALIA